MKTISIEILNKEALKALKKLEEDGLIKLTGLSAHSSKLSDLDQLQENHAEYKVANKREAPDKWDLDEELAKTGITIQEIVDEVKTVRAALFAKMNKARHFSENEKSVDDWIREIEEGCKKAEITEEEILQLAREVRQEVKHGKAKD